jgi:hypothetical protein
MDRSARVEGGEGEGEGGRGDEIGTEKRQTELYRDWGIITISVTDQRRF